MEGGDVEAVGVVDFGGDGEAAVGVGCETGGGEGGGKRATTVSRWAARKAAATVVFSSSQREQVA